MASLRSYRLRSPFQFRQISVQGKFVRSSSLTMRWIKSPDSACRFCFLVKKKNGNAVYRNRCRRILRPIFFKASAHFKEPIWAMIFVNENSKDMTPERLLESANVLLSKMEKSLSCS